MRKTFLFGYLLALGATLSAQEIPHIKADQLSAWKNAETDTVFVLNFWATWCAPCVAELPEFEKLHQAFSAQPVQVILINTDFRRDVEKRVRPFVQRQKLQSQVVFMDETTPNNWIDLVSADWSGAIPATLIVSKRRGFERFFEKQLRYEELEQTLREALAKP
ncbi:MAG: redoxin domain-containing protein [Saprospiraceae bacterium]|nr:redoxin domain-containing protein [Saprospiraceae bacterium]